MAAGAGLPFGLRTASAGGTRHSMMKSPGRQTESFTGEAWVSNVGVKNVLDSADYAFRLACSLTQSGCPGVHGE